MKELILIAAAGESNELGREGDLPWHLPDDFAHFKKMTSGHPIIMGRKTFETFPKPLPNRRHIIISRNPEYIVNYPECTVVNSLEEAIAEAALTEKAFVIGGGEIYRQALPYATKIELTRIHGHFKADTFFPVIDPEKWQVIRSIPHPKDERHPYAFTFQTFEPAN